MPISPDKCPHENMVAYTEDGERFNACRGCNQIFPRFTSSPTGDAVDALNADAEWRYEFRPDAKYPDSGIYTILAPNPDAGKEGAVYSGNEIAMTDTDDKEVAAQIVREHNSHRKLIEALRKTRHTLEVLLTCDHCAACEYCNSHKIIRAEIAAIDAALADEWQPVFSSWRHGGWYVDNLQYPSGAVGCVSRNYPDHKWRIVCDERPFAERPTFPSRIAAARAERDLIAALAEAQQ